MGVAGLWGDLLAVPVAEWRELVLEEEVEPEGWERLARRGGLPAPALALEGEEERREWFREQVRRYLEHDLPALSGVHAPVGVHRLMRAAARHVGAVLNQAELARETGISGPTVHRYLNLLEASLQLVRVEPHLVRGTKRLVRSPKLYWADTGLAGFLAGDPAPRPEQLENLVLCDLVAWRDAQLSDARVLHWRAHTGEKVDLLVDWRGRLLPVAVTVAPRPTPADARQLQLFRAQYPAAVHGALALHAGDEVYWLSEGVLAAPWWRIL
jgi:predicted AAA+ superfamily ATPase